MRSAISGVLLTLALCQAAAGRILDVPSQYGSIGLALAAAIAPDTVRVDCGVYAESGLTLGDGIALMGATADSSCAVLDGGASGVPILWLQGSGWTIAGLTFRNGNATNGAAIYWQDVNSPGLTLVRCRFENNHASQFGGAVAGRPVSIAGCAFEGNSSGYLGGAYYAGYVGSSISSSTFIDNHAANAGGAVFLGGAGTLTDCIFQENTSGAQGGAVYGGSGSTIHGCSFRDNTSTSGGGGVVAISADVRDCEFETNVSGGSGGGLSGSVTHLSDCTFHADSSGTYGGGAHVSGNVARCQFAENRSRLRGAGAWVRGSVDDCLFVGNRTVLSGGGGLWSDAAYPITRSRFVDNLAHVGGGLYQVSQAPIDSCVFLGNTAPEAGGVFAIGQLEMRACLIQGSLEGGAAVMHGAPPDPLVQDCDFFGNVGGDWFGDLEPYFGVLGNFSADAMLCNGVPPESLRVSSASPLLATNNPRAVTIGMATPACEPEGVVIATRPTGIQILADGDPVTTPAVLPWSPGSSHTIDAPPEWDPGTGRRWTFVEWSDGGAASHSVTAPGSPAMLTATFAPEMFVTIEADPGGMTAPPSGWFAPGPLTFTSTADSLYLPLAWTGTGIGAYTGAGAERTLDIVAPITERASFIYVGTHPLTMVAEGGGSVSPASGEYRAGQYVTIRATTPEGYLFDGWTGVGSNSYTGTDSVATIRMLSPITQTAHFHHAGYASVTMSVSGSGVVTPGSGQYLREVPQPIDAIPDPGWEFYRWIGEGSGAYSGPERNVFIVPLGDLTETAVLAEGGQFDLTVTQSADGFVLPGSGRHDAGSQVALQAIPYTGWRFVGWEGVGLGSYSGPDPAGVVTMHGPVTENAVFELDPQQPHGYSLSLSASPTDPSDNKVPPAGGPRVVYLWLTCSQLGLSAFEAGVQTDLLSGPFVPKPDVVNLGTGSDLLLGATGCFAGAPRTLGSWTVLDFGGTFLLGPSQQNGILGAVDCGGFPFLWRDPVVRGFSSIGIPPVTGSNGCTAGVPVPEVAQPPPTVTALAPVSPNPFRGSVDLRFSMATPGRARVQVYDVAGRLVAALRDAELPVGEHVVPWNAGAGATVKAGVYFIRFEAPNAQQTARVVFLGSR